MGSKSKKFKPVMDDRPYLHGPKESDFTEEEWDEMERQAKEILARPRVKNEYY